MKRNEGLIIVKEHRVDISKAYHVVNWNIRTEISGMRRNSKGGGREGQT